MVWPPWLLCVPLSVSNVWQRSRREHKPRRALARA